MPKVLFLAAAVLIAVSCATKAPGTEHYRKYFYNGYLVTNYGDTLVGRIKLQKNYNRKIAFISENSRHVSGIRAADIRSMKINLLVFEKIVIKGEPRLVEKLAFGHYDLFGLASQQGEFIDYIYYLRLPEGNIRITEGNFREMAEKYIFDHPEIRQKIISGELNFDHILDIFRTYNRWKGQKGS